MFPFIYFGRDAINRAFIQNIVLYDDVKLIFSIRSGLYFVSAFVILLFDPFGVSLLLYSSVITVYGSLNYQLSFVNCQLFAFTQYFTFSHDHPGEGSKMKRVFIPDHQ